MTSANPSYPPSYYAATRNPAPERPPLQGQAQTEICVIGAGYTGLATALSLVEKGHQVTVLEAEQVGFGASGRNGGQLVNSYSRDMDEVAKRYGDAAAQALGAMAFEGGDIIRDWITRYAIACDLRHGGVFAAFSERQLRELRARVALWARFGHTELRLLDADGIRAHTNTDLYVGGLLDERSGHVHPLNLALGEAAALERLGGRVHEHTRVTLLEKGAKPKVHTAGGTLQANQVVICGNAYLGREVPQLYTRVMPVSTQIIATEPLGEERARRLMPSGACVEDCNYFLDYYRMSADHRLLFGGGSVYGGKTPGDIAAELRPHLRRTFPELADVQITHAWSGNFALTFSRIPDLGKLDENIYYAHGYSGHGVTSTHLVGRIIAESIDGEPARFDAFAALRNIPFPGGRRLRVPLSVLGSWYYMAREKLGV